MKRRAKVRRLGTAIPRAAEPLVPLTRAEFDFALATAGAAASYAMPMESPSQRKVALEMGRGRIETFAFSDTPFNRAVFAIKDAFEDRAKALSANIRCERLRTAVDDVAFGAWVHRSNEGTWVHPAVLDEIAAEPLEFSVSCFKLTDLATRVAARIAAGGYEDEDFPPTAGGA